MAINLKMIYYLFWKFWRVTSSKRIINSLLTKFLFKSKSIWRFYLKKYKNTWRGGFSKVAGYIWHSRSLTRECIMSQNGRTNFKNPAVYLVAYTARLWKCVRSIKRHYELRSYVKLILFQFWINVHHSW